ncbi:beta-mannosidase [Orussus abietinus]|uniref:beta-mannosidase n=1 Tax=Orussus abietinus TaxID=222816 RepID=UPI000625A213|nr:beta-mannosidase [Orussus abietinus]
MERFCRFLLIFTYIWNNGDSMSLNGIWTGQIQSLNISFPANVPGGIYTDLVINNLIEENLVGFNDIKNRWVGNQSITYETHFMVDESLLNTSNIDLVFHGLDTFANVSMNGKFLGISSNMFLRYTFNVKDYIKPGRNYLKVEFISAVKIAELLYEKQSLNYVVPPKCVPEEYNGECHVNHIRKMQASFGWDWGPAFPSSGIWKDVELLFSNRALLTDITVDIHKNDTWNVIVTVFFKNLQQKLLEDITCHMTVKLDVNDKVSVVNASETVLRWDDKQAVVWISLHIPENLVEKWWPNGYGKQTLYLLKTQVSIGTDTVERSTRIGFRTIKLVQNPLQQGLSFYFLVNDIPVFAKGSNWIPASIFPELTAQADTVDSLLQSAKDAHMNMLRVWGGGVYESDLFYDLADEYGIMIWQDFMFACSMYPTDDRFLESVREEVVQNVKRLKYHPSIVLWAGNNENEAALYGNWYGTGSEEIYKEDYIKLYAHLIKQTVENLDQTRPFVVSSPSDGLFTEQNNFIGPNPYSTLYGDVHYYNYFGDGWNINQYPRTRFASEYGFQSIPSLYTLANVAESKNDLKLSSEFMVHRQHLQYGYDYMKFLISKNLPMPRSVDTLEGFFDFIYLSQLNQAVSVKVQTESYRQAKSYLNSAGEGLTMGALYWQLNDVWQAPSWSSIEFGGRWKMLHYFATEFFAPVIVTPRVSVDRDLTIYVVTDDLLSIESCTVKLNVYKWQSTVPVHTELYTDITIEPILSYEVATFQLDEFLTKAGCGELFIAKKNCVIQLALYNRSGEIIAPLNYVYPSPLKSVDLPLANFRVRVTLIPAQLSAGLNFEIELTSTEIALFVYLDLGMIHGRLSENGFHIFSGKKVVKFRTNENVTQDDILQVLTVQTLSQINNRNGTLHIDYLNKLFP